jgi:hypothetical protein
MSIVGDQIVDWLTDFGDILNDRVWEPIVNGTTSGYGSFMDKYAEWAKWQLEHSPQTFDLSGVDAFINNITEKVFDKIPYGDILLKAINTAMCLSDQPDVRCMLELADEYSGLNSGLCFAPLPPATVGKKRWKHLKPKKIAANVATSAYDAADRATCMANQFKFPKKSKAAVPNYYRPEYCETGFYMDSFSRVCRTLCPEGYTLHGVVCVKNDNKNMTLQCPVGEYFDIVSGCISACPTGYTYYGGDTCINTSTGSTGPNFVKTKVEYPKIFFSSLSLALTGNEIFITDHYNNCVIVYNFSGVELRRWGTAGTGDGQFNIPTGIAITDDGKVVVADSRNSRIQVFN